MGQVSGHEEETHKPFSPAPKVHGQAQNRILRLSPHYDGGIFYDSFEIQAVTHQLNKAMQRSTGSSSPAFLCYLQSPLYRKCLDRISKDTAKTPKRLSCSKLTSGSRVSVPRRKAATAGPVTKGFLVRLWKKAKRGLL